MILNTRAELKLEKGDPQACFEDLKLCHRMAISTECSKLKLGELLFNMAKACNETRQTKQAISYSDQAINSLKDYVPCDEEDMLNQVDLLAQAFI